MLIRLTHDDNPLPLYVKLEDVLAADLHLGDGEKPCLSLILRYPQPNAGNVLRLNHPKDILYALERIEASDSRALPSSTQDFLKEATLHAQTPNA